MRASVRTILRCLLCIVLLMHDPILMMSFLSELQSQLNSPA